MGTLTLVAIMEPVNGAGGDGQPFSPCNEDEVLKKDVRATSATPKTPSGPADVIPRSGQK